PMGGDLRDGAVLVQLTTTPIAGAVELLAGETPAPPPPGQQADGERADSAFTIEALELVLESSSFAEGVSLTGGTRATIGGASAGTLSIDLAAGGLLDEAGTLRAGMPGTIAGSVQIEGFATPILQPFVAAINTTLPAGLRLDLPEDLGPEVDFTFAAESHTDEADGYDIDLSLKAEHASLDAAIVIEGQQIALRGNGIRAELARIAPILDRVAAAHGVRVDRGGRLTLQVAEFAVDLATLKAGDGLDLRGVRAAFDIALTDAAGTVQLAGDDQLRDFRLERFALGLATDDLAGEVRLTNDGSGQLNGKPLASMKTDLTFANLLDTGGAPKVDTLPTFRGEVRVNGIALDTVDAVFGSLYAERGLRLAREIGPKADILLLAASNPQAGEGATDIDMTFRSSALDITAPLTAAANRVRSRGPITLVGRAAGRTAGVLMGYEGPVRITPEGTARLVLSGLDVPIGAGEAGGVRPDQISANLAVTLEGFATNLVLPGPDGKPGPVQRVDIPKFEASVIARAGQPPRVEATGAFLHAKQAFSLELTSVLHGLFLDAPRDPADPMSVLALGSVRPKMTLALTDIPATLARLVPPGMVTIGDKPLDAVLLTRDTLGRTFAATIETFPNPQVADATRFVVELRGQGLKADLAGALAPRRFRLDRAETRLGVTPRVASHLVGLFAADAPVQPKLTTPASLEFMLNKPFEVRFAEAGGLDMARLDGQLDARLTIEAALAALTLPVAEDAEDAEPMTIPPVSLRSVAVDIAAPLRVLGEQGGNATAKLAGRILAADGSTIVTLAGNASTTLKGAKPTGEMPVSLSLTEINSPWIDSLLGKPSLLAAALGETFSLTIEAHPNRFRSRVAAEPFVSLSITAPRFSSDGPIAFAVNKQAIYLHKSVKATWMMGPWWANRYFLGAEPGTEQPAFAFTKQTRVQLDIRRLAIAMQEGVGLFKPDIFLVNTTATIPELASKLSDGRTLQLGGVSLRINRGPTPDQIGFAINIPRMKIGDQPEVKPDKSTITGRIASFADAEGNLTPDAARLNITGGFAPIPTDVIDAFARQDGLLRDALGPTVDFSIDAREFSKQGGTLHAKARTPLAEADIQGRIDDGLFIIDPKASRIEVWEITPELAKRLQKAMPVVATLEKTRDDEPMRVIFNTPLKLPLDGNMDRLNGVVTINIGTARFGTSDIFQTVLAMAQQKTAGEVGRRMPPLKITMVDGLVTYDTYPLPFGEFKLETQGAINLSSKPRSLGSGKSLPAGQLQVLTFIPAGAFAAEAVPALANLPLPLIGNLARLPIRTSGLIASPKNDIAVDLVGEEALNNLTNPGGLLDSLLGGDR
ncbi:hypothetical protein MNBD_PLANCTO03-84, partial [hydrothermal vent metagenome]